MVDRRSFLTGKHGTKAASEILASVRPVIAPIGVQLYTVRDLMAEDMEGTLERVAHIGYDEVEFAGFFGNTAKTVRHMIDQVGLRSPASHVDLESAQDPGGAVFDDASELGQSYVVVPSLPGNLRTSIEGYRRVAEIFNEIGVNARAAGLKFAYHNHAFEFEVIDGRRPIDVLIESTDPTLVSYELDLFWTVEGGGDPMDMFTRYPGRFPMVHVKDMDAEGQMVDVGKGELDFSQVFANAELAGLEHAFVEHDEPEDSIASITASYRYLTALTIRSEDADV